VATDEHRAALDERLEASGLKSFASPASGQYVAFDAAETLAKFMVDGSPDPDRFSEAIGAFRGSGVTNLSSCQYLLPKGHGIRSDVFYLS
jgi:hypothetical protein